MIKNKLFVITLTFFVLLSCKSTKDTTNSNLKVLNISSGPITHLDPQVATGLASNLAQAKSYEALLEVHPYAGPYKLLPALAKEMPAISDSGKTYTFTIKDGIQYHPCDCFNGKRLLSAHDFENTFKRIADPKLMSPHFSYWSKYIRGMNQWYEKQKKLQKTDYSIPLEGVQAINNQTLVFHLTTVFPDFPYLLTGPNTAPIPKEAMDYYNNDLSMNMVGTGAFVFQKFIRDSKVEFVKNKNYLHKKFPTEGHKIYQSYIDEYKGQSLPFIDKLTIHIIKESQTAWLNFKSGKLDYLEVAKDNFSEVFGPNFTVSKELKQRGVLVGAGKAHSNLYYFGFNQSHPLLKNKRIRQAIAHGLDYEKFNKLFFNETAIVAKSILPPQILGNNPPLESDYHKNNKELAKKIIKEEIRNLKDISPIRIMVKNKTISRQVAEFLKNEMEKIGLKAEVEAVSWQSLLDRANKGKYDIFYLAWFVGLPKGLEFFELLYGPNHPGSYNRVGYHNNEFDRLFMLAKKESDLEKQNQIITKMNAIATEDLPIMPLVHTKNFFVHWKRVKNYIPTDQLGGLEKYYDISE